MFKKISQSLVIRKINCIIFLPVILLTLTSQVQSKQYKGAEYRTKDSFLYGRFETSYKSFEKDGALASFFTYHDGGGEWNEIDIEIMGRYNNEVQFNAITPGQTNHVRAEYVNFNPSADFHTYAFEWTPDYVAWFIDGNEVYRQTGAHVLTLTEPQKIMMNVWAPAYINWAGSINDVTLPAFAYYDWVKYYAYTPDSGNYGTNNNFSLKWTDDFESWDQSRWDKASHTWDGNNSDLIHDNAVFNDGKLILCLTDETNIGYTDLNGPYALWARASDGKITIKFSEDLDQASAETKSNYLIPGVVVNNAQVLSDKKSVLLDVSGLDLSKAYNVLILAKIKDLFGNSNAARAVPVSIPDFLSFPIKINIGGKSVNDYLTDQEWSETAEYGFLDGVSKKLWFCCN